MNWFRLLVIIFVIGFATTMFLPAFSQSAFILTTDKNSYKAGDIVIIKGIVSNSPNQLVGIQVKDPNGTLIVVRTVQTDSGGNFSLTFKVPSTSTSGIFSIDANSKVNGQILMAQKTFVQTIPEFGSLVAIVLIFSIISMIAISRKFNF